MSLPVNRLRWRRCQAGWLPAARGRLPCCPTPACALQRRQTLFAWRGTRFPAPRCRRCRGVPSGGRCVAASVEPPPPLAEHCAENAYRTAGVRTVTRISLPVAVALRFSTIFLIPSAFITYYDIWPSAAAEGVGRYGELVDTGWTGRACSPCCGTQADSRPRAT